jgi:cardiolipin synthase
LRYAPAEQGAATLVSAQGNDFVLYRDPAGQARAARSDARPPGLRITRMVGEDAFADEAGAYLRDALASGSGPPRPALFVATEDTLGAAFVLFDFSGRRSVFIAQSASPLTFDRRLGLSLRLFEALTVQSHLFAVLRNPVSSINRLAWMTAQTGAALVPRRLPVLPDPPSAPQPAAPMDTASWEATLDGTVGEPRRGGRMWPLVDGEAYFTALVEAIRDARATIDIQVYIFDGDDYALRIADLLKERSREVRVRVLTDRLGSMMAGQVPSRSPYYSHGQPPIAIVDYLRRDSAIEVRALDNPWLTSDHTKLIVIDGTRAFAGGMNIGREYRYEWHDMMAGLEGPIVARLQRDFAERWAAAGAGGDLAWAVAGVRREGGDPPAVPAADSGIRPLYTRPADPQILRAQLAAMRAARSRIWVQQPYIADDEVIASLIDARRRGVDVRVILPMRNDSGVMHSANLLAAKAFLNNGIRVYGFPGMTHVKAALYDGWACIGSANFDKLSLRVNREIDLATSDPTFVSALERDLFLADFARAREWNEPQPVRWTDYLAEFFADQL